MVVILRVVTAWTLKLSQLGRENCLRSGSDTNKLRVFLKIDLRSLSQTWSSTNEVSDLRTTRFVGSSYVLDLEVVGERLWGAAGGKQVEGREGGSWGVGRGLD